MATGEDGANACVRGASVLAGMAVAVAAAPGLALVVAAVGAGMLPASAASGDEATGRASAAAAGAAAGIAAGAATVAAGGPRRLSTACITSEQPCSVSTATAAAAAKKATGAAGAKKAIGAAGARGAGVFSRSNRGLAMRSSSWLCRSSRAGRIVVAAAGAAHAGRGRCPRLPSHALWMAP
ncbi:MAG: hypothetical protein JNL85_11705 [Rubrivivax sp.]|nr:hypothetical protein [Rubrivivax sp.]